MVKMISVALVLALAACQAPKGNFCAIAKPIRPTAKTLKAMNDGEVKQALAHNRKGAALCGWKR